MGVNPRLESAFFLNGEIFFAPKSNNTSRTAYNFDEKGLICNKFIVLRTQGNFMQHVQTQPIFKDKITSMFEQSLTEEQRFLQDIMTGKIKLIPHDEVMQKLDFVLKNGLQRK